MVRTSAAAPPSATDRRAFLRVLGQGAMAGAVLPVLPDAVRAMPSVYRLPHGPTRDETYWFAVKARFALRDGITPMNAANLCPSPASVAEAVRAATADIDGDASFQNRAKYDALRERVRARLAAYLGADPNEIAIVRNTTEANNTIAGGAVLGPGDEVVLHSENHPSNAVSWHVRAAQYGFTVRTVAVRPEMTADAMLAAFTDAFSPRTRVVSFTDVSNTTGIRLPAREICAAARARGIHAHIDGAQSFGALRIDLHNLGCDSYAASTHKWFAGPKEAGVLYVRAGHAARLRPGIVGVGWGTDAEPGPDGALRFETLGQRDDAVFAGIDAALDFHEAIGPDAIEARVLALSARLMDALAAVPGARIVTPRPAERRAGVVVTRFEGRDMRAMFERLYGDWGISGAATGGVRLCTHICATMADVERAARAVAELARRP
jgi:isopenicillin-N epimerase